MIVVIVPLYFLDVFTTGIGGELINVMFGYLLVAIIYVVLTLSVRFRRNPLLAVLYFPDP